MRTGIFLLTLFLLGCSKDMPTHPPLRGDEVGNGGDTYAGEFVEIGYELVAHLRAHAFPEVTADELFNAVKNTSVVSKGELDLNGKPIDALNYPDTNPSRIEVSRVAWDRLKSRRDEKNRLVFHEYLGILRKDDSHYQISRKIIDRANVCSRTTAIKEKLEKEVGKPCQEITPDDLRMVRRLDLAGKAISKLNLWDFDFLYNLETVLLQDNLLEEFPSGVFRDLKSLKKFNLERNRITKLRPAAFIGLHFEKIGFWETGQSPSFSTGLNDGTNGLDDELIDIDPIAFDGWNRTVFQNLSAKKVSMGLWGNRANSDVMFKDAEITELEIKFLNKWDSLPTPKFFAQFRSVKKLKLDLAYIPEVVNQEFFNIIDSLPRLEEVTFEFLSGHSYPSLSEGFGRFICKSEVSFIQVCSRRN